MGRATAAQLLVASLVVSMATALSRLEPHRGVTLRGGFCRAAGRHRAPSSVPRRLYNFDKDEEEDEEEDDSNRIVSELNRAVIAEDFESAAAIQQRLNRRRAKAAAELDELAKGKRWFEEVLPESSSWTQLGVPLWLKDRLADLDMPFATPIQTSMLRATMRPVKADGVDDDGSDEGKAVESVVYHKRQGDVALRAPTGSGKTVAFLVAALTVLSPDLFLREQRIYNAIVGPDLELDLDVWERQAAGKGGPDTVAEAEVVEPGSPLDVDGLDQAASAEEEAEASPLLRMSLDQMDYFGALYSKIRKQQGNIALPELVNAEEFEEFDPDFLDEMWSSVFGSRSQMKDLDIEEFFELCLGIMDSPKAGTFGLDGSVQDIMDMGRRAEMRAREVEEQTKREEAIDATLAAERERALEASSSSRVARLFNSDENSAGDLRDDLREQREQAARQVAFAYTPLLLMPELGSVVRTDLKQPPSTKRKPLLVVVCPSRELAAQVAIQLFKLVGGNMREDFDPGDKANMFKYRGPRGMRVLGLLDDEGVADPSHLDFADFVVGVPDVLRTLATERPEFFDDVKTLCVDEADLTIQHIAGSLRDAIIQRDTDRRSHFLVGASLNSETMRIASRQSMCYRPLLVTPHHFEEMELNTDTQTMALTAATIIDRSNMVAAGMRHLIVTVTQSQALLALAKLMRYHMDAWETTGKKGPRPRAVVFARDDTEAQEIAPGLRNSLWGVHKIHVLLPKDGQMPLEVLQTFAGQNSRKRQDDKRRSLAERIRSIAKRDGPDAAKKAEKDEEDRQKRTTDTGEFNVWAEDVMPTLLVTTPESARGLDFANITHVYSLHMPANVAQYAHQAGRLARVGNLGPQGVMTSFVEAFEEKEMRELIKEAAGDVKVEVVPPVLYEVTVESQLDVEENLQASRKSLDDLYELFNADPGDLPPSELRPVPEQLPDQDEDEADFPGVQDAQMVADEPSTDVESTGGSLASLSDRLAQLNAALQNGLITEEEFKEKKKKMIDDL